MKKRGLLIGRFQPPHLGHLTVIRKILEEKEEVIIVIAAAQLSHTAKNPLTAGERMTLIRTMLENNNISPDQFWIVPAEDIMDNSLWVHHIKRLVPLFETFYTNNQFTKMLFKNAGLEVKQTGIMDREKYEGTTIRKNLMESKDISLSLDSDVIKLLSDWNIGTRLMASEGENPVADLV